MTALYLLPVLFSILIGLSLLWRLLSKRRSIPCPAWLGWMVEMDNPFAKVCHATTIIENSGIKEGMSVLDAGCGPGRVTIPVAEKVRSEGMVIALDCQAGMLAKTKEKAQILNLNNVTFLEARLGDGLLPQHKFDRALLVAVLGEIPNAQTALQEIFDSLKEEGTLSITEIIFDPHFQCRKKVLKLAESVGFKEKAQFGGSLAYTMVLERK